MLLMIDNYDSFTYNIVQYFGQLGENVQVFRNDRITLEEIAALRPERLVISPYTVNTHVQHIYGKLSIHKRSELISYLRRDS